MTSDFDSLDLKAFSFGLFVEEIEHWPGHFHFVSELCSDACLPVAETRTQLKVQLDLFATLDPLAQSMFVLGIGIGLARSDA